MKDGAKPVEVRTLRLQHARQAPLREELECMEAEGIILKMEEPAELFVPGKKLLLADALSRIPAEDSVRPSEDDDVSVHAA